MPVRGSEKVHSIAPKTTGTHATHLHTSHHGAHDALSRIRSVAARVQAHYLFIFSPGKQLDGLPDKGWLL